MGWPQITIIVLLAINGTMSLVLHGKPKGNWNFFMTLFDVLIMCWLLSAGGFWK